MNEGGAKQAGRQAEAKDLSRDEAGRRARDALPGASNPAGPVAVNAASPAAAGDAAPALVKPAPQLDELMLAMDVVDTLRHRELVLDRELEADDRDHQLLKRLREIYTSQGIKVSDDVLEQGVRALREERFVYAGPQPGVGRSLALLYVTRERWGKWVGGTVAVVAVAALSYQFLIRGPELRALSALPNDIEGAYQGVVVSTQDPAILSDARTIHDQGEAAVGEHEYAMARASVGRLRSLADRLQQTYELRVVSRPGERSGVWRVPQDNPRTRNYYLIVEAIGPNGAPLTLPIKSEEDGRTRLVKKWALRVDEATYRKVAADKGDDGIIEQAVVGTKQRGELDPEYTVATTGAAITKW